MTAKPVCGENLIEILIFFVICRLLMLISELNYKSNNIVVSNYKNCYFFTTH